MSATLHSSTTHGSEKSIDVMHQFEIIPLIDIITQYINISITNSTISMFIIAILTYIVAIISKTNNNIQIKTRLQAACEILYLSLRNTYVETSGMNSIGYFSIILSITFFIFFGNIIGLIPGIFTITSHLSVTLFLAVIAFSISLFHGIQKNSFKFLKVFCPSGTPFYIMPLVVPIEVLSFFFRPASLAIRLFANMLVGHVLLKIIAFFIIKFGGYVAIITFLGLVCISMLEILVAGLQAYVFFVLTCVYLNLSDDLH